MKLPEDAITKLYAVPLEAFTRERNGLATALTKAGHADQARAVRQLRRPSAPLWRPIARAGRPERLRLPYRRGADSKDSAARSAGGRRGPDPATARRSTWCAVRASWPSTALARHRCRTPHRGHAPRCRHRSRPSFSDLRHGRLTQELAAPGFGGAGGHRAAGSPVTGGGASPRVRDAQPEKAERGNVERRAGPDRTIRRRDPVFCRATRPRVSGKRRPRGGDRAAA